MQPETEKDTLVRRQNTAQLPKLVALLLCIVSDSGAYGYEEWGPGAQKKQWIEIRVRVLDVDTSQETAPAKQPGYSSPYYLLLHQRGRIILQGLPGQGVLPYHRLWLKGGEQMFDTLAVEEQRFGEIRLSGLLREHRPDVGILELVHIDVVPAESRASR
jgi:hypothetical protein